MGREHRGTDRGARRLGVVVALKRSEEHALHRCVEAVAGCSEQLAGVFEVGRAGAEIVEQPGQGERGVFLAHRATTIAVDLNAVADRFAVEVGQVVAESAADLCRLYPRRSPGLAGLGVAAEG